MMKKKGSGGARYATMAFTEQGIAMLSSALRSARAIAVNIEIMRTFVKLRGMASEHADLKRRSMRLKANTTRISPTCSVPFTN